MVCQVPAKKVATPSKDSTAAMAELQDDIGDVLEGKCQVDKLMSFESNWFDMVSIARFDRASRKVP